MVSAPELGANLATARALIAEADAGGAELVLLPEYFCPAWATRTPTSWRCERPPVLV